ncbi:MAG: hydroxymethylglutaryl-CoA synthase family protein [Dehalococcoidia bacterium]|nr:hydroxymethylglutaryl-CoA synthase family protein [Dehalococcoidia bacterium]
MVGITSYGGYIPWYRINRMTIYSAMGWLNPASMLPGEKAVANYDEDSLSMAVNASMDCLNGLGREKIDGLYFATSTAPFTERQCGGIIATALDLRPDIRTSDFTGSLRAATTALLSACDTIKAGSAKSIMLCAADCRLGKAGGYQEEMYGDGAAALLLGEKGVIASLEGSFSLSYDFMDHWRSEGERYSRSWEDRWIRDEGYGKFIPEAISGLMKKYNLSPKDIAKVAYPCMYTRAHTGIAKQLGFKPDQIQEHMFTTVGHAGAAYPLMILVAALEDAKPGDKILVASYGNGSEAMFFEVTKEIENVRDRKGIKRNLASKKDLPSYERFSTCREVFTIDTGGRGEELGEISASQVWRQRREFLGLVGSRCKRCGTPQYPPQHVCAKPDCGAIDEMEDYRFSDKKATIFTYTGDSLAFSPNPPATYGIVNFDGGGRFLMDFTDCDLDMLKVGLPVEMSFRMKMRDKRGVSGYFWKATPIRA